VWVHAETPLPVCRPALEEVQKYERLQDLTQVARVHKPRDRPGGAPRQLAWCTVAMGY
jgi:hypothetical protein